MRVTAPYPHPFLFMTDFRQHLLNNFYNNTEENICKPNIVSTPDIFTLTQDKMEDISRAIQFYAPVLESLDFGEYKQTYIDTFTQNTFIVIFASLVLFIVISLPLHILLYMWIKPYFANTNKKDTDKKQKQVKNWTH